MITKHELDDLISMLEPNCDTETVEIVKAKILNAFAKARSTPSKHARSDQQKVDPYDCSDYK